MPSVGGTGEVAPRPSAAATADPVLAAEREHLRRSREFLRLMREDVLGLHAMGWDPVSEEYLKAELYHRAQALRDIPDAPLFFGRLDYAGDAVKRAGESPVDPGQRAAAGECGANGGPGKP